MPRPDRQPPRIARCACGRRVWRPDRDCESETRERRARILADAFAAEADALRRQARRHSPGHADPEDALQDACTEFLCYYEGPPGADAVRYLMAVVKRCAWARASCAAQRHADKVELTTTDALLTGTPRVAVLCERAGPLERAERNERTRAAAHSLGELKPDQRSALVLFALGYSYREIGELCGWTQTKINRCLAEGRAALRRLAVAEESPAQSF